MDLNAVVLAISSGLSSTDAAVRDRSADEVTDLVREYSGAQATDLARQLVQARIVEADPRAQESQLHALAELAGWHQLPRSVVESLNRIPTKTLTDEQRQYVADIRDA